MNTILREWYLAKWKHANVIMQVRDIPSKLQTNQSLTSNEKNRYGVILTRLQEKTQEDILPEGQFGIHEAHAALLQVLRIVEYAEEVLNGKMMTIVAFLNVARAFD